MVERGRLTPHQASELSTFISLVERKYPGARLVIFGSAATGRTFSFSDVDVAVVFDGFEQIPWRRRVEQLRLLYGRGSPISAIGITENELARKDLCYPSVLRAVKAGRNAVEVMKENDIARGIR